MNVAVSLLIRAGLTLLVALVAARLCVHLNTPIPWMIGPLLATAALSLTGAPTASLGPLRDGGQWVIGAALGLYFTPQMTSLVASLWWAIALAVGWSLLIGFGFSTWLYRRFAPQMTEIARPTLRATTYFAGAIGGASEMTLLAERAGARSDLVAAAHSLRLLIVVVVIPFAMLGVQSSGGLAAVDLAPPEPRPVDGAGLLALAAATGAGGWLLRRAGRTNPWFMGALLVTMGLTMAGINWSAMPAPLSNAAQLVIGVSLGVRFSPAFLRTAPRWLAAVAGGTVTLMALCAAFGMTLAWLTGLHPATLILGTSPGGITEMAITAKVLQLGVPVVTALQVCRLVAVLLLVQPCYRLLDRRGFWS